jgi:hypothetical protein
MLPRAPFWLILWLSTGLGACGSKGSVALSAVISAPSAEVARSAVGADVTGGFEVELRLGEYAEESTTVELGTFSIQRDGADVLAPLTLGGQKFPVSLGPGEAKSFELTINQAADRDVGDSLCEGDLELSGSFTDSLNDDRPTAVRSSAFEPSCP